MLDIEYIYNEYFLTVYKYLYSLCKNKDIAEELTQETFCRSIKTLNQFRGDCKISVWLCQIAKNCWYEELRKTKKHIPLDDELEDDALESIDDKLVKDSNKELIYRKIENLEKQTKKVMYYRISSNMSFKEIRLVNGKN